METEITLVDRVCGESVVLSHDVRDEDSWNGFVLSHEHGSAFHLMQWQRLIQSTFGHEPRHIIARSTETGDLVGILPLFLVRSRIFGRLLVSTPHAPYGGILATSQSAEDAIFNRALETAKDLDVQFLELRSVRNSVAHHSLLTKDLYVTFRQVLGADPEANLLSIPKKTRAEIRDGIRNGLEFKVDAIGPDEFFEIYSHNVRDLGTPVFTKRLFENGMREFGPNCRIFSVHWKGRLVAASWALFYKDEVMPYFSASFREYNRLSVNNYMYWMLMKYGAENGHPCFDFGRSKKGTGAFNFKKRWGMVMTDLPYQYALWRSPAMPDTSPLNPKFSLGIQVWRRLPLWLTRAIGPMVSQHLV
jgi:FemAB-related protein (PEP-CTERM system-associated)